MLELSHKYVDYFQAAKIQNNKTSKNFYFILKEKCII